MKEIWKSINGYEGLYKISNKGRVMSLSRIVPFGKGVRRVEQKIMSYSLRSGYPVVNLSKNGLKVKKQIHRLVAEHFIHNPNNKPVVNHKDFVRTNNNVENLEWVTQAENIIWSSANMKKPKKTCSSTTGEKYIYRRGNRFRVCIPRENIDKSFNDIQSAISYRNYVRMQDEKYYF